MVVRLQPIRKEVVAVGSARKRQNSWLRTNVLINLARLLVQMIHVYEGD